MNSLSMEKIDNIYHNHNYEVTEEKDGSIPLTTVVDEEVTNSSHH